MTETNDARAIVPRLEAFLFMRGEPVDLVKIAKALQADRRTASEAVEFLRSELEGGGRGLRLLCEGDRVQLVTKPAFAGLMEELLREELREELTPAAEETLSIIAYGAPVSRSEIEYVRGVNSTFILRTLLMRGLIERAVDPERGTAFLYRTSMAFLRHLGIPHAEALPDYAKVRDIFGKMRAAAHALRPEEKQAETVSVHEEQ